METSKASAISVSVLGAKSFRSSGMNGPNTTRPIESPSQTMGTMRYRSPVKQGTVNMPLLWGTRSASSTGRRAPWVAASGPSFTRPTVAVQRRRPSGKLKT